MKVSNIAERQPKAESMTVGGGFVYNESVSIEPSMVELASAIKESVGKKTLGAVLLFPKTENRPAKRHWISFDDLYAKYQDKKELFNLFFDEATKSFVGMCKVGVNKGEVFLVAA